MPEVSSLNSSQPRSRFPISHRNVNFDMLSEFLLFGILIMFISVVGVIVGHYLEGQRMQIASRQALSPTLPTLIPTTTPSLTKAESTPTTNVSVKDQYYTVEYPSNFFIATKTYDTFIIANNRWEGEIFNYPTTGITTYTNVVPEDMSLREWLDGLSDTASALEPPTKSCSEFIESLYEQTKASIYEENSSYCWYLGINNIQETTVAGVSALEFGTQQVSTTTQHTIFVYRSFPDDTRLSASNILFDIHKKSTSHSSLDDGTAEAYTTLLNTFQIRKD